MKKGIDFIGVGVGAVIVDKSNNVLLLKRKKDPESGKWSIPGGTVEFGETIENAIVRELREELNVEAEIISLLGVTNHIINVENKHWVSPAFLVKIKSGIPENMEPDSHESMDWFPMEDLPEITITTNVALNRFKKHLMNK